jgi:hypothetical protein
MFYLDGLDELMDLVLVFLHTSCKSRITPQGEAE